MRFSLLMICIAAASLLTPIPSSAQTSKLYLTDITSRQTFVVQRGAIILEFERGVNTDGPALVVQETIKCIGTSVGDVGNEYAPVLLFADGSESGDTTAWPVTVP